MIIPPLKVKIRPRTVFLESPNRKKKTAHWADSPCSSRQGSASPEYMEFAYCDFDVGRRPTITTPEQVKKDLVDFSMLEKVRVICRFRPSSTAELREEKQLGLEQVDPLIEGPLLSVSRGTRNSRRRDARTFMLDSIIDSNSSQNRCFRVIGFPMVQSVLAGYNATVFAYGQTGSGKTYTMFGPEGNIVYPQQVGLIQRAISVLFKSLKQKQRGSTNCKDSLLGSSVRVQFVQIYKEQLFDLLNPVSGVNLRIRFDPRTNAPYIENITQNVVRNTKEVLRLTKIAISNRITDKTKMNRISSRSHLLMTVIVEQRKHDGTKISSKLNFGDLAGSESVRKTKVERGSKQFSELKSINLSLSQLTTVINDIVHNRRPAFRSSKLTYLLQDSLGGNTKTTLVVCASPHIFNRDETIRTLTFAENAKTVRNKAKVNKEYTSDQLRKLVQKLQAENEKYKTKVAKLESQIKLGINRGNISNKPDFQKVFEQVKDLELKMELQASTEKAHVEALENKLRLQAIDLDKSLVLIQQLQSDKLRYEELNEQQSNRMKVLNDKLKKSSSKVDVLSTENERKMMVIENLEIQIQKDEQEIKLLGIKFRSKLEEKEEELTSKTLENKDLMGQIISLKKKVQTEKQTRMKGEQMIHKLRSEVAKASLIQGEKTKRDEREVMALHKKAEELKREKDQLDVSLRKKAIDYQKLNRTLTKSNQDLQIALKEAQEEVNTRTLTAQEILEKFSIDEGVLSGIESDLHAVLCAWKNRKRKRKKKWMAPNPNTTIALQTRFVIAYFNIAMSQLKKYEDQEGERDVRNSRLKKSIRKNLNLEKYVIKLEDTIIKLRNKITELKEENERNRNFEQIFQRPYSNTTEDKEMLMYLDDCSGAALRGDDLEDDELILTAVASSQLQPNEKDKRESLVMLKNLRASRKSIVGWRENLKKRSSVDVLDPTYQWYPAKVTAVREDGKEDKLLIHYQNFDNKFDEWITRSDCRLAKYGTKCKIKKVI